MQATDRLPAFDAVDAVEIYNHSTFGSAPDRSEGAYMIDGLLDRGRRVLLAAGDDAHFAFPGDRFGGWIEVWAENLHPNAVLRACERAPTTPRRDRASSGSSGSGGCRARSARRRCGEGRGACRGRLPNQRLA